MKEEPHSVDVHVGKTIRIQRLLRKVSQTELGDRVGVTFQQIQKYEKGSNRVSASMLVEIAGALKVDVRTFFDDLSTLTMPTTTPLRARNSLFRAKACFSMRRSFRSRTKRFARRS